MVSPRSSRDVIYTFRKTAKNKARGIKINVGVSTFVPKAQTPFQWVGQATREEVRRKQELLREQLKIKNVSFNLHHGDASYLEAVAARGDRRLSQVIYKAWEKGCNLDAWDERIFQVRCLDGSLPGVLPGPGFLCLSFTQRRRGSALGSHFLRRVQKLSVERIPAGPQGGRHTGLRRRMPESRRADSVLREAL